MDLLIRMLPALVRRAEDSPEAREYAAFAAWGAAAGEGVRRACAPLALNGRRLSVATTDATWKAQLDRLAPQLIFRINSLLGTPVVTQIVFKIDAESVSAAHPAPPPIKRGDVAHFTSDLAPEADSIRDSALREAFLRAAGSCLARRAEDPNS